MKTIRNNINLTACLIALFFLTALQATSQNTYYAKMQDRIIKNILSPHFEAGIRVMPAFSTLMPQTSNGLTVKGDAITGYGIAAIFGYYFNPHVGVQTELLFNSTARSYNDNGIERQVNLQYVNIPLLLSLNTNKYKRVNFNFVVGPQIGIRTGYSLQSSVNAGEGGRVAVLSVKDNDLGLAYGAGVDFGLNKAKTIRLGVGFRGSFSLIDIGNTNNPLPDNSYYVLKGAQLQTYYLYTGLSILF